MLSRNNFKEKLRRMEPKKERFSIRKFTVGAASVLIGFTFFTMGSGQKAQAAETANSAVVTEQANSNKSETQSDQSSDVISTNNKVQENTNEKVGG